MKTPIENLPAGDRPRCAWCDRKFRPFVDDRDGRRVFVQWNAYDGLFDRLICARRFAVASYQGGYRRKR